MSSEKPPSIEDFLGDEPSRRLSDWQWLWTEDSPFPIRSHRGLLGGLLIAVKRALRPLASIPGGDLWERQRVFNLILIEHFERVSRAESRLDDLESRIRHLEALTREGLDEVMRHNDGLFSRMDQKVDRLERANRERAALLGAALARSGDAERDGGAVAESLDEAFYAELERRHRGTEAEIRNRLEIHLPRLRGQEPILDLGCGRGEALAVFQEHGLIARGVDLSGDMVRRCRELGLEAEQADLLDHLSHQEPQSLGAVVAFHVVEHLPPAALRQAIRLAWGALRPGGLILIETPSPLSLVVGASNFWRDPTHLRPLHPAALEVALESAGFDQVEVIELNPFGEQRRLPEVVIDDLDGPAAQQLADRVNRLRDHLDGLLYGAQDFAIVGYKRS